MSKKQTSLYLTPELRKKMRVYLAQHDVGQNEFIEQAIEEKLKRDQEEINNDEEKLE